MEFLDLEACEERWTDESLSKKAPRRKPSKHLRDLSDSEEEMEPTPPPKSGRRNSDAITHAAAF